MIECAAPPDGLDLSAIASDAGLLLAVEREAKKIEAAMKGGVLPSKDDIRLISFLVGEVRRRIESLTPEQAAEFEAMKKKADTRETRRWIQALVAETETLLANFSNPGIGLSLSRFSQAEVDAARGFARAKGENWSDGMIAEIKKAQANLQRIKDKTQARLSIPQF